MDSEHRLSISPCELQRLASLMQYRWRGKRPGLQFSEHFDERFMIDTLVTSPPEN